VARLLRRIHGISHFQISRAFELAARKKGIDVRDYVKELEQKHGPTAPLKSITPQIKKAAENKSGLVIEGFYAISDLNVIAKTFPKDNIILLTLKRPQYLRKKGIMKRLRSTEKEADTWINLHDTIRRKEYEINKVETYSDRIIINEFRDVRELYQAFEKSLKAVLISRIMKAVIEKKKRTQLRSKPHRKK